VGVVLGLVVGFGGVLCVFGLWLLVCVGFGFVGLFFLGGGVWGCFCWFGCWCGFWGVGWGAWWCWVGGWWWFLLVCGCGFVGLVCFFLFLVVWWVWWVCLGVVGVVFGVVGVCWVWCLLLL
ncbi:hypothetical protein RA273_27705, partial [Pseudomonas syringae pv. tagetis]